jgi:uncharacterized protein
VLIYPYDLDSKAGYPSRSAFSIKQQDDGMGFGVYTKKDIKRGSMVARFSGTLVDHVVQHSLQVNPTTHIYDPHFAGLLLHSCSPNVALDMQDFTIWALKDIETGEALTMDYASTEDRLFKQFECLCSSDNCRHWVTGRKEPVNGQGQKYLKSLEEEKILSIRKTG